MQSLMHGMGVAILALVGTSFILALVLLVLYEVRWIVKLAGQVGQRSAEHTVPSFNGWPREVEGHRVRW
jgi:hypothetical protein